MKKRILAMLLASAMMVSMAACKKDSGTSTDTPAPAGNNDTQAPAGNDTQAQDPSQDPNNAGKTPIKLHAFTDEVPNMIKRYLELHPDAGAKYYLDATQIATTDGAYQPALNLALGLNSGGPDIYTAEAAFVLKYSQGDAKSFAMTYEDLGIDVSKVASAKIAGYASEIGTRDGKLVALPFQATGGALIYRRSIAKDVFGTDEPATVAKEVGPGWDQYMAAAAKLKDKGYMIVSGVGDVWHAIENGSPTGWIVNDKLNIDPERERLLDIGKTLKDSGYMNDTADWQDPWYADMAMSAKVFAFFGPAWLINYVMNPHAPDSSGDWAICDSPAPFTWGGTWLFANSKLNPEVKDVVKDIIEWVTLDTSETGLQYLFANGLLFKDSTLFPDQAKEVAEGKSSKDTVASAVVMEKSDGTVAYLGGQNMFDVFIPAGANARVDNKTQYDEQINGWWRDQVNQYVAGEKDREAAIKDFKQRVKDELDIDS